MISRLLFRSAVALAAASVLTTAQAAPVNWTLANVFMTSTTSTAVIAITGSFTFDATTGVYSNVSIVGGGFSYDTSEISVTPFGADASGLELVDGFVPGNNIGKSLLNLDFASALTNAGGVVNLLVGFPTFQGQCSTADCGTGTILFVGSSGSVTSLAVPEPATLALAGAALLALRLGRRRNA